MEKQITLSDKNPLDKKFIEERFPLLSRIFDNFGPFLPVFCTTIIENNIRQTRNFGGKHFRHLVEFSSILSDESLSDKVLETFKSIHYGVW